MIDRTNEWRARRLQRIRQERRDVQRDTLLWGAVFCFAVAAMLAGILFGDAR